MKHKYILLIFSFFLFGCSRNIDPFFTKTFFAMDTFFEIKIPQNTKNKNIIIKKLIDETKRIENKFDFHNPNSLTSKYNNGEIIKDKEFLDLVSSSIKISKISNGAFDITIKPLSNLWDFEKSIIPSQQQISLAKKFVDYKKIKLSDDETRLEENISVDFGGIAKGYTVDRLIKILKNNNIKNAIINAGGDIFVIGNKFGEPWEIGLQHPRENGAILGTLKLEDKAIVTSGDYERFFEINNIRYHHIIDPKTGYPSKGLISVTIVADNSTIADGLSTALFVMKKDAAIKLLNNMPEIQAILVDQNLNIYISEKLKKYFTKNIEEK